MDDKERDMLLTKLDTDICWIKKMMNNHLAHHWAFTITALSTALGAVVGLVVVLIRQP